MSERPVYTQEFRDGTLLYVPHHGGQLGMFVSHPDPAEMPTGLREMKEDIEAKNEDAKAFGAYIDIAYRGDPEDDWNTAPVADVQGIGKMIQEHIVGIEQHPGAGKDPHQAMLAVMRDVLLAYTQGGLQ